MRPPSTGQGRPIRVLILSFLFLGQIASLRHERNDYLGILPVIAISFPELDLNKYFKK